jgi:hypothetical protein
MRLCTAIDAALIWPSLLGLAAGGSDELLQIWRRIRLHHHALPARCL